MPRIVVLGCSGAGKSTFARALSRITALPYISLDAMFWRPGWIESERAEFRARMVPILASQDWILDGNYIDALESEHISRATHVFLFDLPRWRCLVGAIRRIIREYGRVRPEMTSGCPERFNLAFLRYIWNFRTTQWPKLAATMSSLRADQRVETFHAHRESEATLAHVAREGIR